MIHHEVTATELNDALLLVFIGHEDTLGALSVSVEMPADGADRRAEIEIKTRPADLERRAGGNGSLLCAEALRSAVARVMPALKQLLEPRARGRGGAVFAALGGSGVTSLTTAMPLASRVVLDPRPFVHVGGIAALLRW